MLSVLARFADRVPVTCVGDISSTGRGAFLFNFPGLGSRSHRGMIFESGSGSFFIFFPDQVPGPIEG